MGQVLSVRQKHVLPDLTYDYAALEPHVNAEIMQLHHSKHHATYVNNLNVTEEKYQEALAKGISLCRMMFILIFNCSPGVGSRPASSSKQGAPDFPFRGHIDQL